eukprot:2726435-Pleurochrysis_carterae.AAC.1
MTPYESLLHALDHERNMQKHSHKLEPACVRSIASAVLRKSDAAHSVCEKLEMERGWEEGKEGEGREMGA